MTDHDRFGSGIYLTPTYDEFEETTGYPWDLDTDDTGDLRMSYGEQELRKDVAFRIASRLQNVMGGAMRPETTTKVENAVRDIFREDPRINRINSIDISRKSKGTVGVDATVTSEREQVDMVFEIDY